MCVYVCVLVCVCARVYMSVAISFGKIYTELFWEEKKPVPFLTYYPRIHSSPSPCSGIYYKVADHSRLHCLGLCVCLFWQDLASERHCWEIKK